MLSRLERKAPKLARTLKEFETQFKWFVIWLFLWLFRRGSARKQRQFDPRLVRRVLFLRHDKIGDMIVTLSTFHTLKRFYPQIEIGVLASRANALVVKNDASVTHVYIHHKTPRGLLRTFREIRRQNYDVVIDLMTGASVTSLILATVAAPGSYRFGVGKEAFARYYDFYSLEWRNHEQKLHISEVFRSTLMPFGIQLQQGVLNGKIQLSAAEQQRGKDIADKIRDKRFRQLVLLNPSAGKLDRTWAADKFVRLVGVISRAYPQVQFVVSYAPIEIKLAKRMADAGGDNVSIIPEGLSILDIIALLSHIDLVISVDTSICHIAAELDVPLIALYSGNNVNFSRWRPYGQRVWAVRSPNHIGIEGITLEQMLSEVERLMRELFEIVPIGVGV
jgi:ADP-heptose:LPS heptosyltransferase